MKRGSDVATRAGVVFVFVATIAIAFTAGYVTRGNTNNPSVSSANSINPQGSPPGSWSIASDVSDEMSEQLGALGYLSGYEAPSHLGGVTKFLEDTAYPGLNFYTSGHAPRAVLMDMNGETLHVWEKTSGDVWPALGARARIAGGAGRHSWRRALPYPNGDLVAIFEGVGIAKLDRDSNVLWEVRGGYHHDLQRTDDGKLYILDRDFEVLPRWNEREPIVEDFIAVLDDETGEVLERISILEAFEHSPYAPVLDKMARSGDVFHTNTLQVLEPALRSGAFEDADALISVCEMNTVAAIDLETRRVSWALSGMWVKQHQSELLPNGNILLFDNQGRGGHAQVLEVNPETQDVAWRYEGTKDQPLDSDVLGSSQRLPNGNTLVTESTKGHAVEVTPEGTIAWEFWSPHRAGVNGELVANLYEMLRLPPTFGADWRN